MTGIKEVQDAVLEKLRALGALVELLGGDPAALKGFGDLEPPARNVGEAVASLAEKEALVVSTGVRMGARGNVPRFVYGFAVIFRAQDRYAYFALFDALMDTVPAGGSVAFQFSELHPSFDPPENFAFLPATDEDGTEFWQATFELTEIGA